jgi:uncharacterized protein (TIGR03067 family)
MRRFGAVVALVAGLAGVGSAQAPPPAAVPLDDLGQLQGHWKPLQVEANGQPQMTADVMKQVTAVYDKTEYHLYFIDGVKNNQPKVLKLAVATISLDPTTNPKTIVFEFADGPFKGQKRHGIYEIAGNQLKVCYGPAERPKPTTFAAPAGSGLFYEVWAKQK